MSPMNTNGLKRFGGHRSIRIRVAITGVHGECFCGRVPGTCRARGNMYIDLGSGAPKTSIFAENWVKCDFFLFFAGFHPAFWAVRHLNLKNSQGFTP